MIKYAFVFLFSIIIVADTSHATQIGRLPSKQWFFENVVEKSDLVIHAKIINYSDYKNSTVKKRWTTVKILEVLHGEPTGLKELIIQDWQAREFPLYVQKRGDHAVFWLKEDNNRYYLTNMTWKLGSPSFLNIFNGKPIHYPPLGDEPISLQDIKNLIAEHLQKKSHSSDKTE